MGNGHRVELTNQVSNEEEAQSWEFEQTDSRVTQVKPDKIFDKIKES